MSDGDIVPAARQRREGHRAPRSRQSAIGDRQLPWMQLRNVYRPVEIISADAVEAIHLASLKVLETTGISVQSDNVRALCVENGAELMGDGVRMRFDRGLIEAALATVPSAFTKSALRGAVGCLLMTNCRSAARTVWISASCSGLCPVS